MRKFFLTTTALTLAAVAQQPAEAATVTLKAGPTGLFANGLGSVNGSATNRYIAGGDGDAGDFNGFDQPRKFPGGCTFDSTCEEMRASLDLSGFFTGADLLSARGLVDFRTDNGNTPVFNPSGRRDHTITVEGNVIKNGPRVNDQIEFNIGVSGDDTLNFDNGGSGINRDFNNNTNNTVDIDIFVTELRLNARGGDAIDGVTIDGADIDEAALAGQGPLDFGSLKPGEAFSDDLMLLNSGTPDGVQTTHGTLSGLSPLTDLAISAADIGLGGADAAAFALTVTSLPGTLPGGTSGMLGFELMFNDPLAYDGAIDDLYLTLDDGNGPGSKLSLIGALSVPLPATLWLMAPALAVVGRLRNSRLQPA